MRKSISLLLIIFLLSGCAGSLARKHPFKTFVYISTLGVYGCFDDKFWCPDYSEFNTTSLQTPTPITYTQPSQPTIYYESKRYQVYDLGYGIYRVDEQWKN